MLTQFTKKKKKKRKKKKKKKKTLSPVKVNCLTQFTKIGYR